MQYCNLGSKAIYKSILPLSHLCCLDISIDLLFVCFPKVFLSSPYSSCLLLIFQYKSNCFLFLLTLKMDHRMGPKHLDLSSFNWNCLTAIGIVYSLMLEILKELGIMDFHIVVPVLPFVTELCFPQNQLKRE